MGLFNYFKKFFSKKTQLEYHNENMARFKSKQISYEETVKANNSQKFNKIDTWDMWNDNEYKYKCIVQKWGEVKEIRNFECENGQVGEEISDGIIINREYDPFL